MTELLNRAFLGLTDPNILNKDEFEIDVIMDANFEPETKQIIHSLASEARKDCIALLDMNFNHKTQELVTARNTTLNFNSFKTALFSQWLTIDDPFSVEEIKVTPTFYLSSKIPALDSILGMQTTFCGPKNGSIEGFNKINMYPTEEEKEVLYRKQINYIEKDTKRTNIGTHNTSQTAKSALSDIPHVRVLLRIERELKKLLNDYRLELYNNDTIREITSTVNSYLASWVANGTLTTASASVVSTDYDKLQKLLKLNAAITFVGFLERIDLSVSVKR